jgi:WD40 repeat protein
VWRAGYDPGAFPQFLDRLAETRGVKGNIWTDLFGMTRPESKRLRELLKGVEALPASCRRPPPSAERDFKAWQHQIAELDREELKREPSLQPALRLSPKLRPQIASIKFSYDGTLLLAQDESGIHVLTRDPFRFLLRIPALEAGPAQFDLSSKRILIPAANGRLEAFDIETRRRELLWELGGNESCAHLLPSPDGRFLACFSGLGGQNVRIVDVASKQDVAHHDWNLSLMALVPAIVGGPEYRGAQGAFTPDGSAFLLSSGNTVDCCAWAFDLNRRAELSIGKPLRDILAGDFAFLSPDRIAVMNPKDYKNSGVFLWPGGKWVDKFPIPPYPLDRVTKGSTLLLRPYQDYAVASMGIDDRTVYQVSRAPAVDRYDDVAAAERTFGELALYPARHATPFAVAPLPDEGELASLRSAALAPDFMWLAISTHNRSAAWNLASGKAIGLDPFDGGSIGAEGILTATFEHTEPVQNGNPGKIFRAGATVDLRRGNRTDGARLSDADATVRYRFDGKYILALTSDPAGHAGERIDLRAVDGQQPLWTKSVEAGTGCLIGNAVVLILDAESKIAKRLLGESPALKKRLEASTRRSTSSILAVLQIDTGNPIGQLVYDGGAQPLAVRLSGRTLFVEDRNFRTLAYSIDSGDRLGQQFGRVLATSSARQLAAVQNRPGSIAVFDGAMHVIAEFDLQTNVIFAGFDAAGKRLLTLTGTQDVFVHDLPDEINGR